MIGKLKENTKIKLISLFSAVILWMYVMAVVDPEDTILYENIPITITNVTEINNLNLVIDPDENLVASVYVTGNLSNLKTVNADNIDVYGTITNPIEGKNQLYLRATSKDRVSIDFKSSIMVVNLEKMVKEEREINVNITGKYKDDVQDVELKYKNIIVSGPRSKVQEVAYVQADLVVDQKYSKPHTVSMNLTALDEDKRKVSDITLEYPKIDGEVSFLESKEVSINPIFTSDSSKMKQGENFEISPSTVTIKGSKEDLAAINSINTKAINIDNLTSEFSRVELEIPVDVIAEKKHTTIRLLNISSLSDTFTFSTSEINLLNNTGNANLSDFEMPSEVKVSVSYNRESQRLSKSDLRLFIDVDGEVTPNKSYKLETNEVDVENVKITPSSVTAR